MLWYNIEGDRVLCCWQVHGAGVIVTISCALPALTRICVTRLKQWSILQVQVGQGSKRWEMRDVW